MANISRIQNWIDQLSFLIQEVDASQEVDDIECLKTAPLIWDSATDAVIDQVFPNYPPAVDDFRRRWKRPLAGGNAKNDIIKKLHNARKDLRLILQSEQPVVKPATKQELPEYTITDYARALFNI